jgi:hypothetical protein
MNPAPYQIQEQPFIRRFLRRLPSDLAASFTAEQLMAVHRLFGMRYAMAHLLDLRRTIRLPWGCFYVVLLAGRDERQSPGGAYATLAATAATMGSLGAMAMLFLP